MLIQPLMNFKKIIRCLAHALGQVQPSLRDGDGLDHCSPALKRRATFNCPYGTRSFVPWGRLTIGRLLMACLVITSPFASRRDV